MCDLRFTLSKITGSASIQADYQLVLVRSLFHYLLYTELAQLRPDLLSNERKGKGAYAFLSFCQDLSLTAVYVLGTIH
jgi:hypothetical protein